MTEGNCPLYAIRAATLHRYASGLTNDNAQSQYYLTDLIETIGREGGDVRTITTTVTDPEYDLLCSDVTRPMDLALLEGLLASVARPAVSGRPGRWKRRHRRSSRTVPPGRWLRSPASWAI